MVESKFMKKKKKQKQDKMINFIHHYITKVLVTIIVLLLLLIAFKWNITFKQQFNQYVYHTNFPFSRVKEFFKKYIKSDAALQKIEKEETPVFEEKLSYSKESLYQDGVALSVSKNYMIPSLESGIIVFIGEKEHYNQTIIVQGMNGVDVWYGNVQNVSVKLYDYVEKGAFLGETKEKTLYLAFQKDGKFANYKDYLNQN